MAGARVLTSTTGAPQLRHLTEDFNLGVVATTSRWQQSLPSTG